MILIYLTKYLEKLRLGINHAKKIETMIRRLSICVLWHNDIGYWRDLKDSTIKHFDWLNDIQGSYNEITLDIHFLYDDNYELDEFLDGKYEIGPAADLNKLNQIYEFASSNPAFYNNDYHEDNMLKNHKTYGLIFDYNGTEDYDAKYAMVDFNIGS